MAHLPVDLRIPTTPRGSVVGEWGVSFSETFCLTAGAALGRQRAEGGVVCTAKHLVRPSLPPRLPREALLAALGSSPPSDTNAKPLLDVLGKSGVSE